MAAPPMPSIVTKKFPSATSTGGTTRIDFVKELMALFTETLRSLDGIIKTFDPAMSSIKPVDLIITLPDFKVAESFRPKPFTATMDTVDEVTLRWPYLTIQPPNPINVPPWTLGDLKVDTNVQLKDYPEPSAYEIEFNDSMGALLPISMPEDLKALPDPITVPALPITIPTYEAPHFPSFDETLPELTFTVPTITIDPGNNEYLSRLLDATEAKLYHDVTQGGTGLDPIIENAIWQRESERSLQAHNDSLTKLSADWAKGHFPLPNSMLLAMINESEMNYINKRLDTSRDIAIKQAELAQTNTHFAIEKALAYNQMMIHWTNSIAERVFQASKAMAELQIDLYKANTQYYNLLVDIFKSKITLYEITATVELKKLEAYKTQLEAAKIITDINKTAVEAYKAQIEAWTLYTVQYKAELDAAKTAIDVEQLKIQRYKTEAEVFATRIEGAVKNYNMYNLRNEGEKTKIQAYAAGADAWGKRISGVKLGVDAETAYIGAQADINKSTSAVFEADVKAFVAEVQQATEEFAGLVKAQETALKQYDSEIKIQEIYSNIGAKDAEIKVQEYKIEVDQSVSNLQYWVQQAIEKWKIQMAAFTEYGQMIAQAVSSAMNSDSATSHLSETYSYGEQRAISGQISDQSSRDETEV